MIGLRKALEMMRQKDEHGRFVPFSVAVVTCNRSKKTGGEIMQLKGVTLPHRDRVELDTAERDCFPSSRRAGGRASLAMTGVEPVGSPRNDAVAQAFRKNTINFKLPNGDIRMGHVQLITRFNGERVI